MKVALLNTKETPRARYIMSCFERGLAVHKDECIRINDDRTLHLLKLADVAVQICMVNKHRSGDPINEFRVRAWNQTRDRGMRVLVLDTGFISNQYDYAALQKRDKRVPNFDMGIPRTFPAVDTRIYYELSYDGIKGFGDHCITHTTEHRWEKLQRNLKPWRSKGDHILFMTQPLYGQSSQGVDIFDWYAKTLAEIRQHSALPIVVRIHPRVDKFKTSRKHTLAYKDKITKAFGNQEVHWSRHIRLEDDLAKAKLAVAYSTSAAVAAVLEGVPIHVGSSACIAAPVAVQDLGEAFKSTCTIKREPWLHAITYSQWTCAELKSGKAWRHYRNHAKSPRSKASHGL